MTKQCWHGKNCSGSKCSFDHRCREADCEKGEECKYEHDAKKQPRQMKDSKEKSKKDILCRYHRNCREGENCEYFHPGGKSEKSKNGEGEMQEKLLHFLMKELKEVREEMKGMNHVLRRR